MADYKIGHALIFHHLHDGHTGKRIYILRRQSVECVTQHSRTRGSVFPRPVRMPACCVVDPVVFLVTSYKGAGVFLFKFAYPVKCPLGIRKFTQIIAKKQEFCGAFFFCRFNTPVQGDVVAVDV